jgi:hypothetical protein
VFKFREYEITLKFDPNFCGQISLFIFAITFNPERRTGCDLLSNTYFNESTQYQLHFLHLINTYLIGA